MEKQTKQLYIVSTYYHALISCIKQFRSPGADILVTDYIPQYTTLAEKLRESSIFGRVRCVGKIREYAPENRLDFIFNMHRKNAEYIESQLDFSIRQYDDIRIFHDDTWFAHYLKCAKIPYDLIEDALDSYKCISASPFRSLLHKADIKSWVKNTFRIGYVFCGYDRYTKSVEVNSIDGVEIKRLAGKKLIEQPRKPMFDGLTAPEIQQLKNIFLRDIPDFDDRNSTLLLTQPLFEDGTVSSEKEQIAIYQRLAARYTGGHRLVIKPHPRDNADYAGVFPGAVILDKNMPLEIAALVLKPHFARVIAVSSSCLKSVEADEYITE